MMIALVLIVVGVVFFAKAIGYNISDDTIGLLWPLLLIVLGLYLLSHRFLGHACDDKKCWRCSEVSWSDGGKPSKKKRK